MTLAGPCVNVARRMSLMAAARPDQIAVVMPRGRDGKGGRLYETTTFRELDEDSGRIAAGLRGLGLQNGERIALLVKPSIEFISLVFALFKSGAVTILIDPGMGRGNLLRCLADARPRGFVAIPLAHAVRTLFRRRFPESRLHVTVGRRWFWGGSTLEQVRRLAAAPYVADTQADDPAAIIFTTGSTGPPKGVLYTHGNFEAQATQIRDAYDIQPGEVDLPGFPLFGLFNCAMGVTTVIPDMDPTLPARVEPPKIIEAMRDWKVTQAFGSPAMWNRVGSYCANHQIRIPSLKRVLSAGAPVPARVLQYMTDLMPGDGQMHTPYGATEALPVASISAREVLDETAAETCAGAGTCVGRRFSGIEWKVIPIHDGPLGDLDQAGELPAGQIGELIVSGPVVTREYVTRRDANATGKIVDGDRVWHRMGDVGYLDDQQRFWFCGRMAHRVETSEGTLFSVRCEAIFNRHASVERSALVGIGQRGQQRPVIIVQPQQDRPPRNERDRRQLTSQLRELAAANQLTQSIDTFLIHASFPVDIRHNSKIFREKLAVWAASRIRGH